MTRLVLRRPGLHSFSAAAAAMKRLVLCAVAIGSWLSARAADENIVNAQQAQIEQVRGEIAAQIQLQAFDLLDELVFEWSRQPPFGVETAVVLADVSVPVSFGSGLEALIENHFAANLAKNKSAKLVLAHCPQCTAMVVRSGAKGTVVSRGVDDWAALSAAGALAQSRHALFLDFEIEGEALVLRSRITSLEPALPIVYGKTFSTSTSSPALLRSSEKLKSAADARQEYLDVLNGRGPVSIPVHIGVRSYAAKNDSRTPIMSVPFVWVQAGAEVALTQSRAWTASLSLGASWMPELHVAWMAQARLSRLLTGTVTSLSNPDLYAFFGGSVISIYGDSAAAFQAEEPDLGAILAAARGTKPSTVLGAFQVGLELRVKNRIGVAAFLETLPAMEGSPTVGTYIDFLIKFHSVGVEVLFCF
jgi:hypothetical protein